MGYLRPEDPDFGKCMDLRGQSHSLGDYGLADRAEGKFVAVKRHPLITIPSLLSDSINCLQRLKGTDDVSGKGAHTNGHLKGLHERLVEDPPLVSKRASLPSMRTCGPFGCRLTNMGSAGRNGSRTAV